MLEGERETRLDVRLIHLYLSPCHRGKGTVLWRRNDRLVTHPRYRRPEELNEEDRTFETGLLLDSVHPGVIRAEHCVPHLGDEILTSDPPL